MVTDQIEALQVRVRRGIEVVDQRLLKGLRVARRRAMTLLATAAAGFALALAHIFASAHGIFRSGGFPARVLWLLAGLAFVAALAALPLSIAAFLDARQLSRLQGRYAHLKSTLIRLIQGRFGAGPSQASQFRVAGTGSSPSGRATPCGQCGRFDHTCSSKGLPITPA